MPEATDPREAQAQFLPEIRVARVGRLDLYPVSEAELQILEKGSPDSVYLNFSIFLLSEAVSFTVALLTCTSIPDRAYLLFVVFAVVGYVIGLLLLAVWWRTRASVSECVKMIRQRMPPEGTAQPLPSEAETGGQSAK
jgi:hypothetical protein